VNSANDGDGITGKNIQSNARIFTPRNRSAREGSLLSVYEDKNNQFEHVVPFTDGIKSLNVVTDLKAHETEGATCADFEKNICHCR
jgi:preprotein translocase subunit SecA